MKLYHGTSRTNADKILKEGFKNPYLTNLLEIAFYYAQAQCDEDGSLESVVLEVEVSEDNLRYDYPAMDEPVWIKEEVRDRMLSQIAEEHPEWVVKDCLLVPETAYQYSLKSVRSVRHEGYISVCFIKEI